MAMISRISSEALIDLQTRISKEVTSSTTLEEAAQIYMSILYEEVSDSIVLARLFSTIPFVDLPEPNKEFVLNLARSKGILELIKDQTNILSLLGTRGERSQWDDRCNSQGHIGIPLASSDFIERVPMVSRLLKELGAEVDWIGSDDTELVAMTIENISGIFHVYDAKTEVDNKGRKIIAAQDFVDEYEVKTVFGIGGCYQGTLIKYHLVLDIYLV